MVNKTILLTVPAHHYAMMLDEAYHLSTPTHMLSVQDIVRCLIKDKYDNERMPVKDEYSRECGND